VTAAVVLTGGGCASPQSDAQSERSSAVFTKADAPADRSNRSDTVAAAKLYPLKQRERRWRFTRDDQEPRILRTTTEKTDEGWRIQFEKVRDLVVARTDKGEIVTRSGTDHNEGMRFVYEPALLSLPAEITPGDEKSGEVRMTIRRTADGVQVNEGVCHWTFKAVGWKTIETPAGEFDAMVIERSRDIRMNMARVSLRITDAYAPGVGLIESTLHRRTVAMGVFEKRQAEHFVLAPPEDSTRESP